MAAGEHVDATVTDISTVGVGALVSGPVDEGDRLALAWAVLRAWRWMSSSR